MSEASEIEIKREQLLRRLRLRKQVVGRIPSPASRDRLRMLLLADGATDPEITEAFRQRDECFIAVYEAMSFHRPIRTVSGVLEISGREAEIHQERIARWNVRVDGELSLAAYIFQQINHGMGTHTQ